MGCKVFAWLVVALGLIAAARSQGEWREGRATYYGDEPWLWNIHEGSCGYGYIWEDEPLGWDVAALPDVHPEFSGSCGGCYEVACNPAGFTDNYGNNVDRHNACRDPSQSLVVRITDTCPCNYAENLYSNKRWCCGDMDHLDLSIWAFEKLAPIRWGVVALKYRRVSCDHVPDNKAPDLANPTPGIPPPEGLKRPTWLTNVEGSSPEHNEASARAFFFQETTQKAEVPIIQGGSLGGEWREQSWNAEDVVGGNGLCKKLRSGGGVKFEGPTGQFTGHTTLEAWVKGSNGDAKVNVALVGSEGECNSLKLGELNTSGSSNGFNRYDIYLGRFEANRPDEVVAFADSFRGCGANADNQVHSIIIKNTQAYDQEICVDSVKLM